MECQERNISLYGVGYTIDITEGPMGLIVRIIRWAEVSTFGGLAVCDVR